MSGFPPLKFSEPIPLKVSLSEFLSNLNSKSVLTDRLIHFLETLENNYLSISKLKECPTNQTFLSKTKQNCINYLHQFNLLISKMPPSDFSSFSFGFNWIDILSQTKLTSNNIWFEYYNVMYNIGMIIYIMAENITTEYTFISIPFEQVKSLRSLYSNALFYFNKIQNEVGTKLIDYEKGKDLSDKGMKYMKCLCLMGGYIALMNASYSKFKQNMSIVTSEDVITKDNLEKNLKQRLSIVTEIIFQAEAAIDLLESMNGVNKLMKERIEYKRDYFKGLMEFFQYEYYYKMHDLDGGKLGYSIVYMRKYLEILKGMEAKLPSLGNAIPRNNIQNEIVEYDKQLKAMISDNKIIRNSTNPQLITCKRTEIKIDAIDPEDKPTLEGISENDLISIIPIELREKMNLTINELLTYLSTQLQYSFTPELIQTKINNIQYPLSIAAKLSKQNDNSYIEENQLVWKKILYIQSLKCNEQISSILEFQKSKSKATKQLINEAVELLTKDKNEDIYYRKEFGEVQWNIPKSISDNYIKFTPKMIDEIINFELLCKEFEVTFHQQEAAFNELNAPIEQIHSKMPGFKKANTITLNEDENKIMESIVNIENITSKMEEAKLKIQSEIKNVSILISSYESIKKGTLNENDFISQQKERVNQLISKEIKPIEMKINEKLSGLAMLCAKVCSSEIEISKKKEIDNDNNKFVDYYANLTNSYFKILLKSINGYVRLLDIVNKAYNGLNKIYEILNKRYILKKQTLQRILGSKTVNEDKQLEKLQLEQREQKYSNILKELARLGIDVKNQVSIIEEFDLN